VDASAPGDGSIDVYALGTNGNLYHRRFENGWSAWFNEGNPGVALLDGPGAGTYGDHSRLAAGRSGIAGDNIFRYTINGWVEDFVTDNPNSSVEPTTW
jgi:hypothetical protein